MLAKNNKKRKVPDDSQTRTKTHKKDPWILPIKILDLIKIQETTSPVMAVDKVFNKYKIRKNKSAK